MCKIFYNDRGDNDMVGVLLDYTLQIFPHHSVDHTNVIYV